MTLLARWVFGLKVVGKKNIPKKGGVVLAYNHRSSLDPVFVLGTAGRKISFLAKIELFRYPQGIIFRHLGLIPVDRSKKKNSDVTDTGAKALRAGTAIALAPEGTRNKTDILKPFKFGAVAMAERANVPVVPIAITGKFIPFFGKLKIEYGDPQMVSKGLESANEQLRKSIENVINKEKTK